RLPDSLGRSIDRAAEEIAAIGPGPDPASSGALQRLAGRIGGVIHYQWPDHDDCRALLEQVRTHCYELHDRVTAAYFDYEIEDAPSN
ncbi:MAG: alpha-E domain-containing protein, partial [Chloroflexi bacterium]|nr:alpha-E domain-containing protein [Chloroflexota bacterium]